MYRTVTLRFLESGLPFSEAAVTAIAEKISITFRYGNGVNRVFADGEEVTDAIRSLEVSRNVSKVAAVGGVRTAWWRPSGRSAIRAGWSWTAGTSAPWCSPRRN